MSDTDTIIAVAPARVDTLLSTARECAAVGASVLLVPAGETTRLRGIVEGVHQFTSMLVCGQDGIGADLPLPRAHTDLTTLPEADATPTVLLGLDIPADVHGVSAVLSALPTGTRPLLGAATAETTPVLLAALAAGAHLRVGTADSAETGQNDARLVARASGLARISGHTPVDGRVASRLLTDSRTNERR